MKYLLKFFKNNGHLRGALYFALSSLPIICTAFEKWSEVPPANYWAVLATLMSALIAGLVSVRAYIDTHLSRFPSPDKSSDKPSTTI